jgi:radical SAM protein with 4Fe4S-binding SPASM domain
MRAIVYTKYGSPDVLVQPDGNVNFCVDFPDYSIGNVADSTLHQMWHSERARRFRELRSAREMPVCFRCGAKYMG